MALDPNIALGVRPVEVPNALAQYAQMAQIQNAQNQNALAQYQLSSAQRADQLATAKMNALREAGTDPDKIGAAILQSGDVKGYGEFMKNRVEGDKARVELLDSKLKQSRTFLDSIDPNSPTAGADYLRWHEGNHADPILGAELARRGVTADQSRARIEAAIAQGPQALAQMIMQSRMGMDKFAETNKPHFVTQDIGGSTRVLSMPGLGGPSTVVPGSTTNKTLTPEQGRAAAQEGKAVAHTMTDSAGNVTMVNKFGQVIPATAEGGAATPIKGKPSATFEKAQNQRQQLSRDLDTTIAELKDITKEGGLIDQSTGSGLGRARDVTAGFFGQATEGAIAGAKLKPIADLALKMVPRFEGPQSDKDTQSYKEAAGQLADPSLPSKIRKEAGKTVLRLMQNRKNQFVTTDMASEGTTAGGGVDANNPLLK